MNKPCVFSVTTRGPPVQSRPVVTMTEGGLPDFQQYEVWLTRLILLSWQGQARENHCQGAFGGHFFGALNVS